MNLEYNYLRELGFNDFVHLRKTERDGRKRMAWMQIIDEEILTIRIVLINNEWFVDYVNPDKHTKQIVTINDAIEFIKSQLS